MLLTGVVLNAFISYFLSSIFGRLFYFPVIFFAFIVLNLEILSLFRAINGQNILIFSFLFLVFVFLVWLKKNKPILNPISNILNYFEKIKMALKTDGLLILPLLAWGIFILTAFFLALLVPPTEPDAQSYHCLRVLFWLKDGFISHFEATDMRALCMPINSELFYTWILALSKKDIGFGLLEFFSYFLLIFSSFKIMEFYEIDVKRIIWAILIFTSLPAIVIQISSTQTDLIVAALFSYSIFLILNFTKEKTISSLFFSSLALALSFGVKTTAFFIAPLLFVWFIKLLGRNFFKFFAFFVLNFLIFSSYNYILNFIDYGSFLSNNAFILYNKFFGGMKTYIANIINYFIQFIDFSGLNLGKCLNEYILQFKDFLFNLFSIPDTNVEIDPIKRVNFGMDEQVGAFGILGFLIYLPCLFISLFKKKFRIFSLFFFVPFLILSGSMLYTVYGIRYIVAFVALSFPVLCFSYFEKIHIIKVISILYAVFYFCYASLFVTARPIAYLIPNVLKASSFSVVQDTMRNLGYKFFGPAIFSQSSAYKNAIEPYCKNGAKIGVFAPYTHVYYSAKYLEIENDCRIDVLNLLHIEKYNLDEYDSIVLLKDNMQQLNVITKEDVKNPINSPDKAICAFFVSDRTNKKSNGPEAAMYVSCSMNKDYLKNFDFKIRAEFPFLDKVEDEIEVRVLEVYSK